MLENFAEHYRRSVGICVLMCPVDRSKFFLHAGTVLFHPHALGIALKDITKKNVEWMNTVTSTFAQRNACNPKIDFEHVGHLEI